MKIVLEVAPDVELNLITDSAGKVVRMEFVPIFTTPTEVMPLLYGSSTSDDGSKLFDRFSLSVSGQNGKVNKRRKLTAVKAACES